MSWSDATGGVSQLEFSRPESDRFGISIARLNVGARWSASFSGSEDLFSHIRAVLSEAEERVVIMRYPSELVRLATEAIPVSRSIVPAGTLMYWTADVQSFAFGEPPVGYSAHKIATNDLSEVDVDRFVSAIADSFDGYTSHYSSNPLLARELVTAGYREWAESSMRSEFGSAYTLERDSSVVGIATVREVDATSGVVEVELAGMIAEEQGKGLYKYLLNAVVAEAQESGREQVVISTQSHNIKVQRVWARSGFRPTMSLETSHCIRR